MYGKIFASMYDGTLTTVGPWEALVTFQQFIILADVEGNVDMTLEAISRRTTIPVDILSTGVTALLLPDRESRSPDHDGRRLIPLSDTRAWGWKIVNYQHYRSIRNAEDRREYMRNYQANRRKQCQPGVNTCKQSQPDVNTCKQNKPIAEAEAEVEVEVLKKKKVMPLRATVVDEVFWEELKKNPAYRHIDLVVENGKMDAWLALPSNTHRKKTRRFVLSWLNKIDRPVSFGGTVPVGALCESRVQRGNFLKACGEPASAMIGKRSVCQAHKEAYDARQ